MDECVLVERPGRIALGGGGEGAVLSIADGSVVRFPVELGALYGVLEEVPIQLSSGGSHCRIEAFDEWIRLEYALAEGGRGCGGLTAAEFDQALAWVRARPAENA